MTVLNKAGVRCVEIRMRRRFEKGHFLGGGECEGFNMPFSADLRQWDQETQKLDAISH